MKPFLVILAALSLAGPLLGEPVATLNPTGYVNDFASVFDTSSSAKLDEACRQLDQRAHAQVVVVTVKSLDGANVYDYSLNLFKKWGIGKKGVNRGVLILLAIRDHRYRITIGSGLDSILGEGNVSGFGVEAVPLLRRSDYSSAAMLMLSHVGHLIAEDAGVTVPALDAAAPQASQPRTPSQSAYDAQPVQETEAISGPVYVIGILGMVCIVYLVIQWWKRRQSYSITAPSTTADTNTTVAAATTNIFLTPTQTTSYWNPAETNGTGGDPSPTFGSGDSGGGSCGGGDTGGGGAGGSW